MICILACALAVCGQSASRAQAAEPRNLVTDASFESPLPSWFSEDGAQSYAAGKQLLKNAPDGRFVLMIEGWSRAGSRILSPVIDLKADRYSGALQARAVGRLEDVSVELALFDEAGKKKLASFGKESLTKSGIWRALTGKDAAPDAKKGRLGIVVGGAHKGAHVEVDRVGLFEGARTAVAKDNSYFTWFEAESLADGKAWRSSDHYRFWYAGLPSGGKMLAGAHRVKEPNNTPATRSVKLPRPGQYRLWLRFVTVNASNANTFAVTLSQGGNVIATKEIRDGVADHGGGLLRWVWDSLDADLNAGEAQIALTRPSPGGSWVCRKIDLVALTNDTDYTPTIQDFRPKGFMRFTNLSRDQDPFCLYLFIRRHQGPNYHGNVAIFTAAGNSRSAYVPGDKSKWFSPGDRSPWFRISDELLPGGGRNNLTVTATRKMHTDGFVEGRLRGRLEFAVGAAKRVVKTINIDQQGPRLCVTLPVDFDGQRDEIRSSLDFVRQKEAWVKAIGPVRGKRAKHLELVAQLAFTVGVDDPRVIEREIKILKKLGFNGLYYLIAEPESAVKYYRRHEMAPRFGISVRGLWYARHERSMHHPNLEKIDAHMRRAAEKNKPILSMIRRVDLMDEPGGVSYESMVKSPLCRKTFAEQLKAGGLTPDDLGVDSWDQVVLVGPAQSDRFPRLFYHSGVFRLQGFATFVRAIAQAKRKYLPDTAATYVNYSPPYSGGSWTIRGTDPFMAHRDGGLELGWTEDWRGYGAGPQHLSDTLALLRAAGRHRQPIGSYCIPSDDPVMLRLQYYTLVAGGARQISSYNYGPWYAGIDSWSRNRKIYKPLAVIQHELGTIDEALHDTVRRKTDVAILYNRTAAIWAKSNYTSEQNGWYTHWALAHAGYDADFIAEQDIEAGLLSNYKALYVAGPQLRRRCAAAIAPWVEAGGVLFGAAGAATRDEYNQPTDVLEKVFAAASRDLQLVHNVGRPKYELRTQKTLDTLTTVKGTDAPAVSFDQLCFGESLEPLDGTQVILRNSRDQPAGVWRRMGKGATIRIAAMPGIAYAHEAVAGKDYDPDSYRPTRFPAELRDLIAWPARLAGAARVADTDMPIAEIVRYDGQDRAVVFVIDHEAVRRDATTITLPDAGRFSHAYAASGAAVRIAPAPDGALRMTFPLYAADAIVLRQ